MANESKDDPAPAPAPAPGPSAPAAGPGVLVRPDAPAPGPIVQPPGPASHELATSPQTPVARTSEGGNDNGDGGDNDHHHRRDRTINVRLERTAKPQFPSTALYAAIRKSTEAISFKNYSEFMDAVLFGREPHGWDSKEVADQRQRVVQRMVRPFAGADAYAAIKAATEVFLMIHCGVRLEDYFTADWPGPEPKWSPESERGLVEHPRAIPDDWRKLLVDVDGHKTIPYLALIQSKLRLPVTDHNANGGLLDCEGALTYKLTHPLFMEALWCYWHEEGMLVQTMNALAMRFQNRRGPGDCDPLAQLELDPLHSLSRVLWGYIQDEPNRLSVNRRNYEYDHQYGLSLVGRPLRTADSRSKFLESLHSLLCLALEFYRQDDDTTVVADGFPLLSGLRELQLVLTQGGHNQYGDLTWVARQEMLIQQWILSRPELREFLPRRKMVAYPQGWMGSVDAMKTLQGWTDVSVLHFSNLGQYGELIAASVRFGTWTDPSVLPDEAANWARSLRSAIQGYCGEYRCVTGVDLTACKGRVDTTLPGLHLKHRLEAQRRSRR